MLKTWIGLGLGIALTGVAYAVFVAVTLVTPKTLTKEQRKLLEQLSQVEDRDFEDESFMDKVRNIFG